jgi:parallel beta-helix repeat protein
MGRIGKPLALMLVLLFILSLVTFQPLHVTAQTRTLTVPDQYQTIQDAVNNARAGDTVFVKQGTYYTYVNDTQQLTIDKPITLIGENPENTVIDGVNKSTVYVGVIYHPYTIFSGINITSSHVTISGFKIRNAITGIYVYSDESSPKTVSSIKIIGNTITNCSSEGTSLSLGGDAIGVYSTSQTTDILISRNNITNNTGAGVNVYSSDGNGVVVKENFISGNRIGISLQASNSLIADNSVVGNNYNGIWIALSKNVTVQNNTVNENGKINFNTTPYLSSYLNSTGGLMFQFDDSLKILNNNITGNHKFGLQLEANNNSIIQGNNILNNGAGIQLLNYVYGGRFFSVHNLQSGNVIYKNNLIDNKPNAIVETNYPYYINEGVIGNGTDSVSWDNGTVGNYWSDYNGNGSYVIDKNNVDRYPLSEPVVIPTASPTPDSLLEEFWFQALTIVIVLIVVVLIALLLFRRHRKTITQTLDLFP